MTSPSLPGSLVLHRLTPQSTRPTKAAVTSHCQCLTDATVIFAPPMTCSVPGLPADALRDVDLLEAGPALGREAHRERLGMAVAEDHVDPETVAEEIEQLLAALTRGCLDVPLLELVKRLLGEGDAIGVGDEEVAVAGAVQVARPAVEREHDFRRLRDARQVALRAGIQVG